jgi:hypothetical protein
MHYEELHNLYSSPSTVRMVKSRRIRREGDVARMGEVRTKFWLGSLYVRLLVGRPRCKWEDNNKIYLKGNRM